MPSGFTFKITAEIANTLERCSDDAVLARRGLRDRGDLFHYGAPLAEGLMVDDTVGCPPGTTLPAYARERLCTLRPTAMRRSGVAASSAAAPTSVVERWQALCNNQNAGAGAKTAEPRRRRPECRGEYGNEVMNDTVAYFIFCGRNLSCIHPLTKRV
jgi:hypothetical protein